jgi:hypothetical protein
MPKFLTTATPGAPGPAGPKGDKGDTGNQGNSGGKGDKGDSGVAGYAPTSLANSTVTAETVVATFDLAANALSSGAGLNLRLAAQVSSTATLAFKIRMGTAGTTADPVLVTFATTAAGVANAHVFLDAFLTMLTSTTATATGTVQLANASLGPATAAFAAATVNLTVANKITVTVTQSVAQTLTSRAAILTRILS